MNSRGRFAFDAYGVVVTAHLAAQLLGADTAARWTQWALMPVLAAALLAARQRKRPLSRLERFTLAGVGFSWLGDTLPHFVGGTVGSTEPGITSFLVLVGMFAVAQTLYAVAFWPYRDASVLRSPWLLAYLGAAVVMVALCAPGAGPLLPAVVLYAALIAVMAALATGVHRLTAMGAILFMISDSVIALGAFAPWWNLTGQGFWVMSTYAAAQFLIVFGVVARSDAGPSPRSDR